MKPVRYLFAGLLCSTFTLSVYAEPEQPEIVATVDSKPINEISGVVKSRSYENLYWVHNDSGGKARIFAINSEGRSILPTYSKFSFYGDEKEEGKKRWKGFKVLFSENIDWEDMTVDEHYLYIADTGNNRNDRQDLGIYIISEIDPTASTQSASIKYLPVRYPEQSTYPPSVWHYDSESLFNSDGSLYLITKHRVAGSLSTWEAGANLYRLDTDYKDEDNLLTFVDTHKEITAATGAEVSPDGQTLAVISLTALWLFDKPAEGDEWLSSNSRTIELDPGTVRQVEAVTWEDDSTVLIINEQREMFRIDVGGD